MGGVILYNIGIKLSSQPKVEASRGVESRVCGPHCLKYFPHGAELFLHASFLNGVSVGGKDSFLYLFRKNLEEWHRVLEYSEVFWDAHTGA